MLAVCSVERQKEKETVPLSAPMFVRTVFDIIHQELIISQCLEPSQCLRTEARTVCTSMCDVLVADNREECQLPISTAGEKCLCFTVLVTSLYWLTDHQHIIGPLVYRSPA